MSQINFDPTGNGMTVSQSLNLFGDLRTMPGEKINLYSKR